MFCKTARAFSRRAGALTAVGGSALITVNNSSDHRVVSCTAESNDSLSNTAIAMGVLGAAAIGSVAVSSYAAFIEDDMWWQLFESCRCDDKEISTKMIDSLWDRFDINKDGSLSRDEIEKMFDFLFAQTKKSVEHHYREGGRFAASERRTMQLAIDAALKTKEEAIKEILQTLDTDQNGQVSKDEFTTNFKLAGRQIFMPLYCSYTADKAWDHIILACEKGMQATDADLDLVWSSIDTDGNGTVEEQEAFQIIPLIIFAIRDKRLYESTVRFSRFRDMQMSNFNAKFSKERVGSSYGMLRAMNVENVDQSLRTREAELRAVAINGPDRLLSEIRVEMSRPGQTNSMPSVLKRAFDKLDVDNDGHITKAEFKSKIAEVYSELKREVDQRS